jgi:hypothetical protein
LAEPEVGQSMSEPVQLAQLARQHLASALGALQANGIPDELMAIADPIAATMGILHRIERSGGSDLSGRDEALANVRGALQALQKLTAPHASVEVVMDSIAQSLSRVHALTKFAPPQPAPQAYAPPQPAQQAYAPPQPAPQAYAPPQPAPQAYAPPQPAPQAYAPPQPAPQAYAPPQPAPQAYAPPQPAPQAVAAFAPMPQQASAAYTAPTAAPRADAAPFKPASARARIDVELGTHSASNFYKGLGGNDVIEAGGIFVATYKPQAIGVSVDLRVLMPGNYEFVATAAVQWIREGDGSTEPGFGARFTQISPEGRQLVYRYTRNREPIFYDDL